MTKASHRPNESGDLGDPAGRYRRDGYVAPLSAVSKDDANAIILEISALRDMLGAADADVILRHKPHLVMPTFAALVRDPRVTDKVAEIIGPDLLCWTTNLFAKQPGDGKRVSWHQDGTYWGLSSNDVVTAWVALSDSVPENGCLRVIPGSHLWPQQPHHDTYAPDNLLTRGQEISVEVDEAKAVNIILSPGQMSLHDVMIAHASNPNGSQRPRLGVAIRYVATSVSQAHGLEGGATLARGTDRHGNFALEPRPTALADQISISVHQRAIEETNRLLLGSAVRKESPQHMKEELSGE